MPDPRDPFANLDPSKLVALDGEEDRPQPKQAATGEVEFAPPRDERVLELDLPPPRRGVTAPQPPPIPRAKPTGPLPPRTTGPQPPPRTTGPQPPPRTTGPLPRTTGPLPPRTTAPLPRPEPGSPGAPSALELAAAAAVAAVAAREAGAAPPPSPPPPASWAAPPAPGATTLPDAESPRVNPRMAFAAGMALALGVGFLPAHLYASFAERSYATIRDEATHVEPAVNDAVYQAEVDERDTAISQLKRAKMRIAAVTALVWLATSGALGFAWLKLVQSRLPADE